MTLFLSLAFAFFYSAENKLLRCRCEGVEGAEGGRAQEIDVLVTPFPSVSHRSVKNTMDGISGTGNIVI